MKDVAGFQKSVQTVINTLQTEVGQIENLSLQASEDAQVKGTLDNAKNQVLAAVSRLTSLVA